MNINLQKFYDHTSNLFENPSLQSQHLTGLGAVNAVENRLKAFYGKRYALLFCNATTAISAISDSFGLQASHIITSPLNWGGALASFVKKGSKIGFGSVSEESLNMGVSGYEKAVSPKTQVLFHVDYNGVAHDGEALRSFCTANKLLYVADCSQSLGAFFDEKPSGYYADAVIVSFTAGKTIYGGEGGAVVTDNEDLYKNLLRLTQHPYRQKVEISIRDYEEYGLVNGRINPIAAIWLDCMWESYLDILTEKQTKYYNLYREWENRKEITRISYLQKPESSTFFRFTLQHKNIDSVSFTPFYPQLIYEDNQFLKNQRRNILPVSEEIRTLNRKAIQNQFIIRI